MPCCNGFTQLYGVGYFETFSLVDKLNSISKILSLATNFSWPLYQLDVKNVVLHGDIKEVYIGLPPGFVVKGQDPKKPAEIVVWVPETVSMSLV